jgi:hypothetical protein
MTTSFASTFLACGGIFVLSFVAIGAFGLQNGCGERVLCTFESHA